MGGCYNDYRSSRSYSSSCSTARERAKPNPQWQQSMKEFSRTHELSDLLSANKAFFRSRKKGFIAKLAEASGIKNVSGIPKEFSDIEYEVKFDMQPQGIGPEPSILEYLDAFDFPVGGSTRFLKDPVHNFAVGINHFIGDDSDERLVVIEKCGKLYLKEKGLVVPTSTGIPYERVVIKRTEERYEAPMNKIIEAVRKTSSEPGVEYRGKIRKEKGDDFVLDANDGRIYSFTVTRAHLTRANETKETETQRQLEIEYAGYIPGFKGFERDSEQQIVRGMVGMAKYTYAMYNNAPVLGKWKMSLCVTGERKYDFVTGNSKQKDKIGLLETSGLIEPLLV